MTNSMTLYLILERKCGESWEQAASSNNIYHKIAIIHSVKYLYSYGGEMKVSEFLYFVDFIKQL